MPGNRGGRGGRGGRGRRRAHERDTGALSRVSLFVFNGVVVPSLDLSSKTPFFALTFASYFLVLLQT